MVISPKVYRVGTDAVISVTLFDLAQRAVLVFEVKERFNSKVIVSKTATFQPEDRGLLFQLFDIHQG